jgi:hypothetical protein
VAPVPGACPIGDRPPPSRGCPHWGWDCPLVPVPNGAGRARRADGGPGLSVALPPSRLLGACPHGFCCPQVPVPTGALVPVRNGVRRARWRAGALGCIASPRPPAWCLSPWVLSPRLPGVCPIGDRPRLSLGACPQRCLRRCLSPTLPTVPVPNGVRRARWRAGALLPPAWYLSPWVGLLVLWPRRGGTYQPRATPWGGAYTPLTAPSKGVAWGEGITCAGRAGETDAEVYSRRRRVSRCGDGA